MDYSDYLMLFLTIKSESTKLSRIQDLIQLNMRKISGNSDFRLSEAYTCIRSDVTVSISRIFAVGFISKESGSARKRYYNRFVSYRNY
jgi:hypothetical protein